MGRALVFAVAVVLAAPGCSCSPGRPGLPDAGPLLVDAPRPDDGGLDAAADAPVVDASTMDAPRDAPVPVDARTDAGRDAPIVDAPRDDGPDAPRDAPTSGGTVLMCAPFIPPGATAGIAFSPNFWSGFRFEVPAPGLRITRVGVELDPDGAGTAFGAIVRLSSMSDTPDDPMLGSPDVLVTTPITVPAAPSFVVVEATTDLRVDPGYYAVVFGTGAFGGTLGSGTIPSSGGSGCRALPRADYPFTIRQSDGMFILQGAEPHMFVELAP